MVSWQLNRIRKGPEKGLIAKNMGGISKEGTDKRGRIRARINLVLLNCHQHLAWTFAEQIAHFHMWMSWSGGYNKSNALPRHLSLRCPRARTPQQQPTNVIVRVRQKVSSLVVVGILAILFDNMAMVRKVSTMWKSANELIVCQQNCQHHILVIYLTKRLG